MQQMRPPMYVLFKYRLYPFRDQERELIWQLDELKFLWNYALEERQTSWKCRKESVGYASQCKSLTQWRNYDTAGPGSVYIHVAQDCLHRLDKAFKAFFKRIADYPHFKSEVTSLTCPDAYNGAVAITGRRECHGTLRYIMCLLSSRYSVLPPAVRANSISFLTPWDSLTALDISGHVDT